MTEHNTLFVMNTNNTYLNLRYSRVGGNKPLSVWNASIGPYVVAWMTATELRWEEEGQFEAESFHAYLRTYRQSARVSLVPRSIPGQMPPPSFSERYPIASVAGRRHHAVSNMSLIYRLVL